MVSGWVWTAVTQGGGGSLSAWPDPTVVPDASGTLSRKAKRFVRPRKDELTPCSPPEDCQVPATCHGAC